MRKHTWMTDLRTELTPITVAAAAVLGIPAGVAVVASAVGLDIGGLGLAVESLALFAGGSLVQLARSESVGAPLLGTAGLIGGLVAVSGFWLGRLGRGESGATVRSLTLAEQQRRAVAFRTVSGQMDAAAQPRPAHTEPTYMGIGRW
ncbi:MAG: hypothetical protein HY331_11495 [Chloroflexi bacterium]|nr:hypothetical protein [Chloroflexota bacterium]